MALVAYFYDQLVQKYRSIGGPDLDPPNPGGNTTGWGQAAWGTAPWGL